MSNASRIVEVEEDVNQSTVENSLDSLEGAVLETDRINPVPQSELETELQEAQVQTAVENLPEKFKGKSAEEIAESYINLEKEFGRKSQEIGEMRKLYDDILQKALANQPKQDTPQEADVSTDIYDDPEGVVKRLVQRELAPLQQERELSKQEKFNENLQKHYPNAEEILTSKDFAEWVQGSKIRMDIYYKADHWDWDAANELLSTYTALHTQPEPNVPKDTLDLPEMDKPIKMTPEQKAARDAQLRAATTEKGSTGETSRKVFRRADLGRLLRDDPEKYYALEPEIRQAYAEGRVR